MKHNRSILLTFTNHITRIYFVDVKLTHIHIIHFMIQIFPSPVIRLYMKVLVSSSLKHFHLQKKLQIPMSVRSFISLLPKTPSLSESIIEPSSASSSQPSSHLHHHFHRHHHHHLHNHPHLLISRLLSFSACSFSSLSIK